MNPVARCKLRVSEVVLAGYAEIIKLTAEYDEPLTKEDHAFSNATPIAGFEFQVQNPKLYGCFKPGQKYYVDLTPVPEGH